MRDVVGFLSREAQPVGGAEPSDAPCDIPGFVALTEGAIVGVGLGGGVGAIDPDECYVYPSIVVAAGRRRQGIGRALTDALAAAPRTTARGWLVHASETAEPTRRFLESVGFERRDEALVYENDAKLEGPPRFGHFTIAEYRGGDAGRDTAIAACARARTAGASASRDWTPRMWPPPAWATAPISSWRTGAAPWRTRCARRTTA